jgi:hypothetical protein
MSVRCVAAALLLWLAGCACESEAPVLAPVPPTSVAPAIPVGPTLPSTSRTDLPASAPMLTLVVQSRSFLVTNRALVESWPDAERVAVGQTRPLGDAAYPVVEREVDDASDALVVAGLRDAMTEVVSVDRARATIVHAEGTATAFAIRADVDVHYARVLAAVFAAGLAGFNQSHLVLEGADGTRDLSLAAANGAEPEPALGARIAGALAGTAPGAAAPARTMATLSGDGLVIRRGSIALAPGCTENAALDADAPTIPSAALTTSAIDACLAAAGISGEVLFHAPGTMRYGDVVGVLEALTAHHAVSLAASLE